MLGNYLQQTTSADDIFRCIFLGALRVNPLPASGTFCHLLITFTNRIDPDQTTFSGQKNIGGIRGK